MLKFYHDLYGNVSFVDERHRHRYEVNPDIVAKLEEGGLTFTGKDETGQRMEIVEIDNQSFRYRGVQFHPEFKSRPAKPSPFLGLIGAATGQFDNLLHPSPLKSKTVPNGVDAPQAEEHDCLCTNGNAESSLCGAPSELGNGIVNGSNDHAEGLTNGATVKQANGYANDSAYGYGNNVHR